MPANTVMGFAYYLINHIKGIPDTLDLYLTDNHNITTGRNAFGNKQTVTIDPTAARGTCYRYTISLSNTSSRFFVDFHGTN